jgi:hypothetical protein
MSRQPDQIKDGRPPFILIEEAVLRDHKLTAYQIAAYVTLVMYANHKDGDKAFPSHRTIGIVGGMSARQAKRAVDALAEKKLISIEPNHDKKTGAQTSNIYTILPITTPRLSVMGGLSNGLGAPDSQSYKPDEVNQIKETNAATAAQATETPAKSNVVELPVVKAKRPIFDAIAAGGFNLTTPEAVKKSKAGGRIGALEAWVKEHFPGATDKTINAFYTWFDERFPGASRPRELVKFTTRFLEFHDEKTAAKAADQKADTKQAEAAALWEYERNLIEGRSA